MDEKLNFRPVFGIGVGIIMLIIASFFTMWFMDDFVAACGIATLVSGVPYCAFVLPSLMVNVPGDRAWVMVNPWWTESQKEQDGFSGFRTIKAQRAFQSGWHFVYPGEKLVKIVDMSRKILVVPEAGETVTTKGGQVFRIDWFVAVAVLPWGVINYTKTNEEDIRKQVKGRVLAFMHAYFGDLEARNVSFGTAQLADFKAKFELQFGGEKNIDKTLELPLGIWTGTPKVISVRQSNIVEEAAQLAETIARYSVVAQNLVQTSGGSLTFKGRHLHPRHHYGLELHRHPRKKMELKVDYRQWPDSEIRDSHKRLEKSS